MKKVMAVGRYSLLCIFLLTLYFLYGNMIFLVLFGMMLFFLPASYLICKKIFSSVVITIESNQLFGNTGDSIPLHIYGHNQTIFPLLDTTISYTVSSSFYPSDKGFEVVCPIEARKRAVIFTKNLQFVKCGCYTFHLQKIRGYDYFHIFSYEKEITGEGSRAEILVYPIPYEVENEEVYVQNEGFDEYEDPMKKGTNSGNVNDVREYIPGDRLQRVHWKVSAKVGKWMVKENEAFASSRYVLLPELTHVNTESLDLEMTMSYLYGLAKECVGRSLEFEVHVYQQGVGEFLVLPVRNKEDLEQMMLTVFYQKSYDAPHLALEVLKRADIFHGELVHITSNGVSVVELD